MLNCLCVSVSKVCSSRAATAAAATCCKCFMQAAAAAAQEADGVPVSPLTGRPLSPRAQEFR